MNAKIIAMMLLSLASSGCAAAGAFMGVGLSGEGRTSSGNFAVAGGPANTGALKEGEACARSYLLLVTVGDASVATAASNGRIRQILAVEQRKKNRFLGFVSEYCVRVIGS